VTEGLASQYDANVRERHVLVKAWRPENRPDLIISQTIIVVHLKIFRINNEDQA